VSDGAGVPVPSSVIVNGFAVLAGRPDWDSSSVESRPTVGAAASAAMKSRRFMADRA
jgi:hypothetical protein